MPSWLATLVLTKGNISFRDILSIPNGFFGLARARANQGDSLTVFLIEIAYGPAGGWIMVHFLLPAPVSVCVFPFNIDER